MTDHPVTTAAVAARLRAAGSVFAEEEAAVLVASARTVAELGDMVARRVDGVPLEQVVGWAELCGIRVALAPGVFVPRRRSALLVDEAVALLVARALRAVAAPVVVDLCCGSGALGLAVATRSRAVGVGPIDLVAADIDPVAVRCARSNLAALGSRVYCGDLDAALPVDLRGRVDLLVANVPYVPSAEVALLPREAREHEPGRALDGGRDGLAVLRRVAAAAPAWLAPGGALLVETGEHQARRAAAAVRRAGLRPRVVRSAELDATVVIGRQAEGTEERPGRIEERPGRIEPGSPRLALPD